ncbi:hypothetical protein [Xanthomonas euvesicatoria]|uniref:hypothetical protein n=1 Tax=Xanthomonas euvesicatoria TaxID=456327 RepID=UPI0030C7C2B1
MHAPARTDERIHRVHRPMIETGGVAQNFSPGTRQTLTNDSRQKSGEVQVGQQRMHVGSLPSHRIDMPPTASRSSVGRPTLPSLRLRAGSRRIAAPRHASPTQARSKKMAAP